MNTTSDGAGLRRVTGWLLVVGAVTFAVAATMLSSTFEWPDILRKPPEVVLPAFNPTEGRAWSGPGSRWPGPTPSCWSRSCCSRPRWAAATTRCCGPRPLSGASVLLSLIGFLRWVFVVPALAGSYVAGDPTTQAAVAAAWTAQHQFGGGPAGRAPGPAAGHRLVDHRQRPGPAHRDAGPLGGWSRPHRQPAVPDRPGRHPGHRGPRLPRLGPGGAARQHPVGTVGDGLGRGRPARSGPPPRRPRCRSQATPRAAQHEQPHGR